jgi:hypothetical protein
LCHAPNDRKTPLPLPGITQHNTRNTHLLEALVLQRPHQLLAAVRRLAALSLFLAAALLFQGSRALPLLLLVAQAAVQCSVWAMWRVA